MSNKTGMSLALGLMLSITAYLSKTWFDGVNANATQIISLKEENYRIVEELRTHNVMIDERLAGINRRLDEINDSLRTLLNGKNKGR